MTFEFIVGPDSKITVSSPHEDGMVEFCISTPDDLLLVCLSREQALSLSQLLVALYSPAGDPQ